MPTSEADTPENMHQTPEKNDNEDNLDLPDELVADDVGYDSLVPESQHGPSGVKEVISIDHGVAAEAPAVRTYLVGEAIDRRDETGVLFVDVREAHEVTEGIVPGAMHIPLERLETAIDPDSPYHKAAFDDAAEIVFYCRSGRRSAVAAQRATEMGIDQVAHVEGGIHRWADAGGPVETVRASDRL